MSATDFQPDPQELLTRDVATSLNRALTLLPRAETADMQTTMINDSMAAYSTAVVPSS